MTSGDAGVDRQRRRQSYSFDLTEAGEALGRVTCEVAADRGTVITEVVDVDLRAGTRLDCRREALASDGAWGWTLRVDADETVDRGSVRLHPAAAADERRVLAGAAAALLLYQELATDA